MASFSSPTIITTNTKTPFLPKSPQLSSFKFNQTTQTLRSACRKVSCKATNNNDDGNNGSKPVQFDRRNLLISLGGMTGAAMTLGGGAANTLADPIAPNLDACALTDAKFDNSVGDRCCPPAMKELNPMQEFKFEVSPVMKLRRPAHIAMQDAEWLADYKRAIALMKALPDSDPRSFMQQARVHCAYCDGSYLVQGHKERYEVHGAWLFAPFHRWYLYFFERILGKLINKPSFALPYWNWDHPDGMLIPGMFKDPESSLFDPNRSQLHQNKLVDLTFDNDTGESNLDDQKQICHNLALMKRQMVNADTPDLFFGDPYRAGDTADIEKGAGTLESLAHNAVHSWTGSQSIWAHQDMGAFWSAGRDPIFYCHHANVDRLWSVWRHELPGPTRVDIKDSDYRDAYFILYDENAVPTKVFVRDSFDTEKLGYNYQPQDLPWNTDFQKTYNCPPEETSQKKPDTLPPVAELPKRLDSVLKTSVKRPTKSRTKAEVEAAQEELVIRMDVTMTTLNLKYDVFINEVSNPQPGDKTTIVPQFAGSFTSMGHRGGGDMGGMTKKIKYKVGLSRLLNEINAANDEFLQVTLVPKAGGKNIVINDVKIELVSV